MDDCLKEKVEALRGKLKVSTDERAVYLEISDLLFQAGKISAAMNILEKSMARPVEGSRVPDDAEPGRIQPPGTHPHEEQDSKWLFDRGLDYADAFLYEDAVACLSQALECGLDNFETHYCLAGVYKSLDRLVKAEFHCRRSLTLNPRFAPGYILLGSLLKKPGALEESVTACKKAVLIDPDCTAAYYDLACYYSLLSKREQALAAIEMAFCKGFNDFDWVMRDPDLDTLRLNPEFSLLLDSYRQKNS
jgi:tetratricopeptide (TPR) repeat protein